MNDETYLTAFVIFMFVLAWLAIFAVQGQVERRFWGLPTDPAKIRQELVRSFAFTLMIGLIGVITDFALRYLGIIAPV